jgi:alanine racemase
MNMMTVDVTNLESVKKDDEVVLIGSQNDFQYL